VYVEFEEEEHGEWGGKTHSLPDEFYAFVTYSVVMYERNELDKDNGIWDHLLSVGIPAMSRRMEEYKVRECDLSLGKSPTTSEKIFLLGWHPSNLSSSGDVYGRRVLRMQFLGFQQ